MRGRYVVAWIIALGLAALSAATRAQSPPPPYRMVVNQNNPVAALDRRFIEDAFLKKVTTWPDGDPIRPVDLAPSSPVRERFTDDILHRSLTAVRAYWQQRIFSGRDLPPPEMASEADVMKYVAKHEGGIGYVSGATALVGVKTVAIR
jgi:ABC-type phosphate transport system substrate-binding protein